MTTLEPVLLYPDRQDFIDNVTIDSRYLFRRGSLYRGPVAEDVDFIERICKKAIDTIKKKMDLLFECLDGTLERKVLSEEAKLAADNSFPLDII